jgi:hypothetical protein
MIGPTMATERLVISPLGAEDAAGLFAYRRD